MSTKSEPFTKSEPSKCRFCWATWNREKKFYEYPREKPCIDTNGNTLVMHPHSQCPNFKKPQENMNRQLHDDVNMIVKQVLSHNTYSRQNMKPPYINYQDQNERHKLNNNRYNNTMDSVTNRTIDSGEPCPSENCNGKWNGKHYYDFDARIGHRPSKCPFNKKEDSE